MPGYPARGVLLSSAILYLAIVAIWALVLMPRWLRPHHTSSRQVTSNHFEPADTAGYEDLAWADDDLADVGHGEPADRDAGRAGGEEPSASGRDREPGREGAAAPDGRPLPAERRARILRARRRTLIAFIVLTAGATGMAAAHVAASWVVVPPAVMLAGFVLLLREAARIDAERARTASRRTGLQTGADLRGRDSVQAGDGVRARGGLPAEDASRDVRPGRQDRAPATGPTAEIIDISDRMGDQLYDQYTDAAVRAVGD
jgi:hypothetical protein